MIFDKSASKGFSIFANEVNFFFNFNFIGSGYFSLNTFKTSCNKLDFN